MAVIESPSNERLKRVRKLAAKRRERTASGLFVVEGYREVKRAHEAGIEIEELFVSPPLFLGENEPALIDSIDAPTHDVAPAAFESAATRDRPDGLIAVARQFDTALDRQPPGQGVILVAEGVERPGNLGTMIRTACAAGVGGVVAVDPQTDVFGPEVVRSSVGTLFAQPVSVATAADTAAFLKAQQRLIVTASPDGDTDYWDVDMTGPVAIVVGSEQHGVTPTWLDPETADAVVRIPMAGVDSINVAAAAAVLLFDAIRQRHTPTKRG